MIKKGLLLSDDGAHVGRTTEYLGGSPPRLNPGILTVRYSAQGEGTGRTSGELGICNAMIIRNSSKTSTGCTAGRYHGPAIGRKFADLNSQFPYTAHYRHTTEGHFSASQRAISQLRRRWKSTFARAPLNVRRQHLSQG